MKYFLIGLFCLLLGWFAGARFGGAQLSDQFTPEQFAEAKQSQDQMSEQIAELEQDLDAKEVELAELKTELDAHRNVAPVVVEVEVPTATMAPFMANAQSMAADIMKAQKQQELGKLKRTLSLTPEQIVAVEEFYSQDAARQSEMMDELFSGKSMEEIQEDAMSMAADVKYHSVSQLLKDILTPEQQDTYDTNQEREALERKEATAYRELSVLQGQFVLNEEQKDTVFAIYYEKDYAVSSDDWEAYDLDTSDPEFIFKSQAIENERLLEALSEALTPEQLEQQRKQLESEVEMQRKAMQMFGGQFGNAPAVQ